MAYALGVRRERFGLAPPASVLWTGVAWVALCVVSLAWSENAAYTLGELRREVLYGVGVFVLFHATTRSPRELHLYVTALVAGALLLGAFEWLANAMPGLRLAPRYHALEGSFSTHLVLIAPLLIIVAAAPPVGMGVARGRVALLAAMLVAAGLATGNRMLWIALLAALACALLARRRGAGGPLAPHPKTLFVAMAGVIALAFAATSLYKAASTERSIAASLALDERPAIWMSAVAGLVERPLLGHGFGREIFAPSIEQGMAAHGSPNRFRHGHNIFIDTALQLGLVGFGVLVWLLVSIVRRFAHASHARSVPIGIAGMAAVTGFLVKNLTDDFFYRPSSLIFWAVVAMMLATLDGLKCSCNDGARRAMRRTEEGSQ